MCPGSCWLSETTQQEVSIANLFPNSSLTGFSLQMGSIIDHKYLTPILGNCLSEIPRFKFTHFLQTSLGF